MMTLKQLQNLAAARGVKLRVLVPGGNLPEKEADAWLCVPGETAPEVIRAAAARFARVYVLSSEEEV